MEKAAFYRGLMRALLRSNFRFRAEDISQDEVSTEHDALSASVRLGAKIAPILLAAFTGFELPDGATDIDAVFAPDEIQRRLDRVREYAVVVCFKYILSQPVIVAVVEADEHALSEIVAMARRFDEVVQEMTEFTGSMGGIRIGKKRWGATKLSVTGLMLFVFFDGAAAARFDKATQKQCRIRHFLKGTCVVPWMVDVTGRTVRRHSGLPILGSMILSAKVVAQEAFGTV